MSFENKIATLPSGNLPYWVAGEGEPLLYIHPAGGVMLTPFVLALAQFRTVYIPVIPGFDETPMRDGVATIRDLAALATEFATSVIGQRTDVMGASFGGWIALWMAAASPEAVDLLVLEAPAGLRFGMDAASLTPEAARANLFAYPEKAADIAPPRARAIANGQAFQDYAAGVFVDEDLAAAVSGIRAPSFILMATRDVTIPAETGRFLAATIPLASLTYIHDAAHALEVDQPELTLKAVKPFLKRGQAFIVNRLDDAD